MGSDIVICKPDFFVAFFGVTEIENALCFPFFAVSAVIYIHMLRAERQFKNNAFVTRHQPHKIEKQKEDDEIGKDKCPIIEINEYGRHDKYCSGI